MGGGGGKFEYRSTKSETIFECSKLGVAVALNGDTGTLYVDGAAVDTNSSMTLNPSTFSPVNNYIGESQWPDPLFNGPGG